jgi:hypothetical protein
MPARLSSLPAAAAAALVLALGAAACNTPSVPIPPPSPDDVFFEVDADEAFGRFSHQPRADFASAIVYVFNRDVGRGVITTANPDGSVDPTDPFPAVAGDRILITFEVETQLTSICLELRPGRSSAEHRCD